MVFVTCYCRYKRNRQILREGMAKLGFEEFLDSSHEGYIITSYKFPTHPNFNFETFYTKLNERGKTISFIIIYFIYISKHFCKI